MLAAILNILTLAIIGGFAIVVYMAYITRPVDKHTSTPLDIMKTLDTRPDMRASISELSHGEIGRFEPLSTTDDNWSS
jgi:hypothetical protein